MSEIVCSRCGHPNSEAANYCSSCGFDLHRSLDETTEHHVIDFSEIEHAEPITQATFVVKRGAKAGSRYSVDKRVTTIGRHPESDIFLDDVTVSRRHAEVRHEADQIVIADVGSLNGTYLNRARIESSILRSGDEVQIGKFKLVFLADEP
jgi:pSer/pThr/pTyr-binding forkhead associated (FHA) protein